MATIYNAGKNDITCIYAAKSLAPFLKVTTPDAQGLAEMVGKQGLPPFGMASLAVTLADKVDKMLHPARTKQERMAEEEQKRMDENQLAEYREDLRKAGIATEQEHDAFCFASNAAMELSLQLSHRSKNGALSALKKEFETFYLPGAVNAGIRFGIADRYWQPMEGEKEPQIVNPEFKDTAMRWLLDEAYSREGKGEFAFLDRTLMAVDGDNITWRRNEEFDAVGLNSGFKWSEYCGCVLGGK